MTHCGFCYVRLPAERLQPIHTSVPGRKGTDLKQLRSQLKLVASMKRDAMLSDFFPLHRTENWACVKPFSSGETLKQEMHLRSFNLI